MKFQTKMRIIYAILGMLAAIVAGSIYYAISMGKIKEQERENLSISAQQLGVQYNELIRSMKDVSYYLLSDADVLTAITNISTMKRTSQTQQYFLDAEAAILSRESNDYISRKFYRVVFCNDNCEPIVNERLEEMKIREQVDYKEMPWYEKAKKNKDTFTILGIHKDTWGAMTNPQVLSVVKQIKGKNMGYIEVQQKLQEVQEVLKVADPNINVCLMNDEGEVIYQNREGDLEFCRSLLKQEDVKADYFTGSDGVQYLATGSYVKELHTLVLVYKEQSVIQKGSSYVVYTTFFLMGTMMLFSLLYVTIASRHLTKPMIQLQKALENTSLENLNESVKLDFQEGDDEFRKMGQVFGEMRSRLYIAIEREKQLSTLQLQTQFDMLQAQVNPHFIYNVLNVISGRGSVNDDEVICDICDNLAGMLRYSTDTKKKYATLREEISYLELYFSLLKYRYRHKLEYQIDLDPMIEVQTMPKLVVQQLVENSISHGFKNSSKIMKVSVWGYHEENYWIIKVSDNGEGFSEKIQKKLEENMKQLRIALSTDRKNVEMQIGGMGLLNTYARLYLLYGEKLVFQIGNKEDSGAQIVIGAPLQ